MKPLSLFTALSAMVALPAGAQVAPPRAPAVVRTNPPAPTRSVPAAPVPANPDFAPDQQQPVAAAPAPAPLPPPVWDLVSAEDLLHYIQQIGAEGLNPGDYDPQGLLAAIGSNDITALSAAATQRFDLVSSDLALGHVKKPARIDWFVADNDLNAAKQDALLRSALAQ
ncbi:MAG TPA: hypothetical protein VFW35_01965, partial [Sphingomicrobium sp.]|nr:hypothetical protein [Sphingomicrobium sp.]